MMKKKSIFDLFPGIAIYDTENVVVKNPFSGEGISLTPEEVAVYDYLKGCELMRDYKGLQKGLDWFRSNNTKAYMVLLD
jgi:hypothetical protein